MSWGRKAKRPTFSADRRIGATYFQIYLSDICIHWGCLEVDLFTTHSNRKSKKYFSGAGWKLLEMLLQKKIYLFLPIPLLYRVIVKLCQDKDKAILVALW